MLLYFVLSLKLFIVCLSASLTTDILSKAIMNPSSVEIFSNIVSVTGEGWVGAEGTLLLVFQIPEIVR